MKAHLLPTTLWFLEWVQLAHPSPAQWTWHPTGAPNFPSAYKAVGHAFQGRSFH